MSIAQALADGYAACVRTFGDNLKLLRQRQHVTQIELARRLAVQQGQISAWETGRRVPEAPTVKRIADVLDVEPKDLLAGVVTDYDKLRGATVPIAPPPLGEVLTRSEMKALRIFRDTSDAGQPLLIDHMQTFQRGFPRPESPESSARSDEKRTGTTDKARGKR